MAGDSCSSWYKLPHQIAQCGNYDDGDFSANTMCCTCGGGTTGVYQFIEHVF